MKEKLFTIFSEVMEVPVAQISEDSSPDTITNWDSLRQLNLVFALEDAFGVKFLDDDIMSMQTVGQILQVLENSTAGEASSAG